MPRYFFDIEGSAPDLDGTELAGLDAAREVAVRLSGELLRDAGLSFWTRADWRLHVRDEDGSVLLTLRLCAKTGDLGACEGW